CVDTAELLGLGNVTPLPALNSFFQDRGRGPAQTAALKSFLAGRTSGEPAVLVTHQVNITALTDIFPTSGEIVVVHVAPDGAVVVAGRIAPDEE
ncbi:MAG: histidine phosphatase family protein, partial [Hyphomicrobiales bacterium]